MTDPAAWHRVTVLDEETRRGTCSVCGPVRLRRRERRGAVEWSCGVKRQQYRNRKRVPAHRRQIDTQPCCERCGFFAAHQAQLDVHHRDGDHGNNAPENLEVLCAHCHRLEHLDASAFVGPSLMPHDLLNSVVVHGLLAYIERSGLPMPSGEEVKRLGCEHLGLEKIQGRHYSSRSPKR